MRPAQSKDLIIANATIEEITALCRPWDSLQTELKLRLWCVDKKRLFSKLTSKDIGNFIADTAGARRYYRKGSIADFPAPDAKRLKTEVRILKTVVSRRSRSKTKSPRRASNPLKNF